MRGGPNLHLVHCIFPNHNWDRSLTPGQTQDMKAMTTPNTSENMLLTADLVTTEMQLEPPGFKSKDRVPQNVKTQNNIEMVSRSSPTCINTFESSRVYAIEWDCQQQQITGVRYANKLAIMLFPDFCARQDDGKRQNTFGLLVL